jgi:ankyrin repeat protein
LLQGGANVNALDKDGWTPLHAAAHWEQEESCQILGENGADFEIRNFSVTIFAYFSKRFEDFLLDKLNCFKLKKEEEASSVVLLFCIKN